MENLEKLDSRCDLTLEDFKQVFQSCSKLVELQIIADDYPMLEIYEYGKNHLQTGFQRLRCFDLTWFIDNETWPVIQEILT